MLQAITITGAALALVQIIQVDIALDMILGGVEADGAGH